MRPNDLPSRAIVGAVEPEMHRFISPDCLEQGDGVRPRNHTPAPRRALIPIKVPCSIGKTERPPGGCDFQKLRRGDSAILPPTMARYEIPEQLPEFVECGDAFIPSNEATLEEWQRHKNPDNSVNQILKLAAKLALPDNTPLLPRLRALARANVLAFNRKF